MRTLFEESALELGDTINNINFPNALKNHAFQAGLTVHHPNIRVKNEPWLTGRIGWSALIEHPSFGEIRVSRLPELGR